MPRTEPLGRRIKLNDLHVLMEVIQAGSMGKAARRLSTSQPAISRSIAELERAFGVSLLERTPQGIQPTRYASAIVDCGVAVFDNISQCFKSIDFLTDAAVGELRIGGNEAIIAGLLPAVFHQLRSQYPGITIHVSQVATAVQQYSELRERKVDLILGRIASPVRDEIESEILFHERTHIVAGLQNRLTRRRKIELRELIDEPWTLPPRDSLIGSIFAEGFRASGLPYPKKGLALGSIHLHTALVASGPFLTILPASTLRFSAQRLALKILPMESPIPSWPVGIMTLKNRIVPPAARLFIACARKVARSLEGAAVSPLGDETMCLIPSD